MLTPAPFTNVFRGDVLESVHVGHAVIADGAGHIIEAWGDPDRVILPRSSCKMVQALPLLESGAGSELTDAHLALACASHEGEPRHVELVIRWLSDIGLTEDALLCGPEESRVTDYRDEMIRERRAPGRVLNNCSGKHTGFLMLTKHLKARPHYVATDHPIQIAIRAAFEEVTDAPSPGWGIDGCSAPNHAVSMLGMARAMATFATATGGAMARLRDAMMAHPELVANEDRACTHLMRAGKGALAVKTGADVIVLDGMSLPFGPIS